MRRWIWLSLALKGRTQKPKNLISHFGTASAVYEAGCVAYKRAVANLSAVDIERLCDKRLDRADSIIKKCSEKGIRIITPDSKEYPQRLWNIPNPPMVIYAKGNSLNVDERALVGVVGTRNASSQGLLAAKKFGREIAECGGVVATGLAKGVDAKAAYGALEAGGTVIGVLGCGVDICYPRENRGIFAAVEKKGTIISEYPPGVGPTREAFPERNRIVSGISLGVAVIEAPKRSGALITASCALDQNRDVFVVPYGIFEENGVGSNELIRDGAIPVVSGYEVMSEYDGMFGVCVDLSLEAKAEAENEEKEEATANEFKFPDGYLEKFSADDRAIIEAIGGSELRSDEIAEKCGFRIEKILACLTLLEIRGKVKQLPGARFKLKDI